MARFDVSGLEETIREMQRLGQESGDAAKAMLQAGAEKMKSAWRAAIMARDLVKTGEMLGSVGYRAPKDAGTGMYVEIYPQGVDSRGVRNAEKAFINHYGTTTHPATRFVDDAEKMGEAMAVPAMEAIWDEFIESGQVPRVPKTPNHPGGVSKK